MTISIQLNEDIERRLSHLAEVTEHSKTFLLTKLIEDHFDELEDIYLAEATLQRVRTGEEKTYSLQEVEKQIYKHQ